MPQRLRCHGHTGPKQFEHKPRGSSSGDDLSGGIPGGGPGALVRSTIGGLAELAATLRQAFSGIVAGNIKSSTVAKIKQLGPFQLSGDPDLMQRIDQLLGSFVGQQRMKLPGSEYVPCYTINV